MEEAIEHATATTCPIVGTELIAMTPGPSHFEATSSSFFMHDFKLSRTEETAALLGLPASFFNPFATGNVHSTHFVSSLSVGKPAYDTKYETQMKSSGTSNEGI
jgi:hypothetical protein